jgi:hypothetical protein
MSVVENGDNRHPNSLPAIILAPVTHLQREVRMCLENHLSLKYEKAIDDAIATCGGDIRGALKALLMVNQVLEIELEEAKCALHTIRQPQHVSLQPQTQH